MFGVVFPDRSFPMDVTTFAQIDPFHYVLDMTPLAGSSYYEVKDLCIFLLSASSLPPGKSLSVYIQPPGNNHPFIFCGAISLSRPSAVLSLPWPHPSDLLPLANGASSPAKIGVSIEDAVAVPAVVDLGRERRIEKMALKVGENLFNFMQSFCGVDGSRLVVPMDILDRWFNKFQERAKKDPNYLKGFEEA